MKLCQANALCQAYAGRWAAVITKQEGAADMPRGFNIEVTIFMEGQRRDSYCFLAVKDKQSGCTRYTTRDVVCSHAEYLACGMSKREGELVRLFVCLVEDLCHHLLDGWSVGTWKAKLPVGERKAPKSWRERRPLIFSTEKSQLIILW